MSLNINRIKSLGYKKIILILTVPILVIGITAFWLISRQSNNGTTSDDSDSILTSPISNVNSDGRIPLVQPELKGYPIEDKSVKTSQDTLAELKKSPEYTNPLTDISYTELFRNSDKYNAKYIEFTGEVVQVLGESGNWSLRVNVTKKGSEPYSYYDDAVLIISYAKERLIEDDIIKFVGFSSGVTTYESVVGQQITVPLLAIYEHQIIGSSN